MKTLTDDQRVANVHYRIENARKALEEMAVK